MHVGQLVEVHTKFNGTWSSGFEIAVVTSTGYQVRRISDGSMLPNITGKADVRPDDAQRR